MMAGIAFDLNLNFATFQGQTAKLPLAWMLPDGD